MTQADRERRESALYPATVEHLRLEANGQSFYAAAAGPADGPLVVLLHGFPEFSYGWRHQLGPLAAAGLRALAPDQRGYGLSSKPAGRSAYALEALAADVIAIAAALGRERVHLVGHDWGGVVAWHLATMHPQFVDRAVILNAPHPATLGSYVMSHPSQAFRSSYIALFQLPWLPEALLASGDHALMQRALTSSSRPGTFSAEELEVYREAWSMAGALTAMLNWYRAMSLAPTYGAERVTVPVRVIWGDRDTALEPGLAEQALARCDHADVVHLPEATHWLHHEQRVEVNRAIVEFLTTGSPASVVA